MLAVGKFGSLWVGEEGEEVNVLFAGEAWIEGEREGAVGSRGPGVVDEDGAAGVMGVDQADDKGVVGGGLPGVAGVGPRDGDGVAVARGGEVPREGAGTHAEAEEVEAGDDFPGELVVVDVVLEVIAVLAVFAVMAGGGRPGGAISHGVGEFAVEFPAVAEVGTGFFFSVASDALRVDVVVGYAHDPLVQALESDDGAEISSSYPDGI